MHWCHRCWCWNQGPLWVLPTFKPGQYFPDQTCSCQVIRLRFLLAPYETQSLSETVVDTCHILGGHTELLEDGPLVILRTLALNSLRIIESVQHEKWRETQKWGRALTSTFEGGQQGLKKIESGHNWICNQVWFGDKEHLPSPEAAVRLWVEKRLLPWFCATGPGCHNDVFTGSAHDLGHGPGCTAFRMFLQPTQRIWELLNVFLKRLPFCLNQPEFVSATCWEPCLMCLCNAQYFCLC